MFEPKYIEPHILFSEDDEIPVLAFGESQSLSWFRGYRMQVSMSPNGRGDNGSSESTLGSDLRTINESEHRGITDSFEKVREKYAKFIVLSHILEASNRYEKFISWMQTNPKLFNDFVRQTAEFDDNFGFEDFDLASLIDNVKEVKELDTTNESKVILTSFGNMKNDGIMSSVISIGKDYIAVKSFDEEVWHILDISDLFPVEDNPQAGIDGYYGFVWHCLVQRLVYVVGYTANLKVTQHYSRSYNFDATTSTIDKFESDFVVNDENLSLYRIIRELYEGKNNELHERRIAKFSESTSASISTNPLD